MFELGFTPKRDKDGQITGWVNNEMMQQYCFAEPVEFPVSVSIEWYRNYGTYLDYQIKSLTRFHYGTSMKSFRSYRDYLYLLAILQLLYKDMTGYSGADFGFDAFRDKMSRLDIALNNRFDNKRTALDFIERCSHLQIPYLNFTLPEELPRKDGDGIKNGNGIYFLNDEQCLTIYLKDDVDPKARRVVRVENRFLSAERLNSKVEKLNMTLCRNLKPIAMDLFRPAILQHLWWEKAKYIFQDAVPLIPMKTAG
jgi:hypothetical protein